MTLIDILHKINALLPHGSEGSRDALHADIAELQADLDRVQADADATDTPAAPAGDQAAADPNAQTGVQG